jgi:purine nucleosidase
MIALNTTTKVKLNDDILMRIRNNNSRYGSFVFAITRFYADFHRNVNHVEGGFFVHDPSAVMYLIDPTIFTLRQGPVRVVREGIATASDVDVKRFLERFESVMTRN